MARLEQKNSKVPAGKESAKCSPRPSVGAAAIAESWSANNHDAVVGYRTDDKQK